MSSIFGPNRGLAVNNENSSVANNLAAKAVASAPSLKSAFKDVTNSKLAPGSVKKSNLLPTKGATPFKVYSETPKSSIKDHSSTVKKNLSNKKKKDISDDDLKLIREYFNSLPPVEEQLTEVNWAKKNVISDDLIATVVPLTDTLGFDDWRQDEYPMAREEDFEPPPLELQEDEVYQDSYWDEYILAPTIHGVPAKVPVPDLKYDVTLDESDELEEFHFSF